jgi:thioredoxin 2
MNTIVSCSSCGAKNRIPADKQHLTPKCGRCGAQLVAGNNSIVRELTDQNFQEIVNNTPLPVLVDFYSPTCGPCQALAPGIIQLAKEYAGRAVICKLDTSRHQMTAGRFQIRGVPTLIFFKNGQPVDQVVGAVPLQELQQRLDKFV